MYLIDYQNDDGYITYAILEDNNVYGLAYNEDNQTTSIVKNEKIYVINNGPLLQKYNNDYLEDELIYLNNDKLLIYTKTLDNGYSVILRYIVNQHNYNILINHLFCYYSAITNKKMKLNVSK